MSDGIYCGPDYRVGAPPPFSDLERRVATRLLEDLDRPRRSQFGGLFPVEKRSNRIVSEAQIVVVIRALEIALNQEDG